MSHSNGSRCMRNQGSLGASLASGSTWNPDICWVSNDFSRVSLLTNSSAEKAITVKASKMPRECSIWFMPFPRRRMAGYSYSGACAESWWRGLVSPRVSFLHGNSGWIRKRWTSTPQNFNPPSFSRLRFGSPRFWLRSNVVSLSVYVPAKHPGEIQPSARLRDRTSCRWSCSTTRLDK